MAEHDKKILEQDIDEMFRNLDSNLKMPVTPNVQNIFDKAEQKKTKILPFGKYGKVFAAAAAVIVLIVAAPVINDISSASIAQESDRKDYSYLTSDEEKIVPEMPESAQIEESDPGESESEIYDGNNETVELMTKSTADEALRIFFSNSSANKLKDNVSAGSSEKIESDEPKGLTEEINDNRFIDLIIDKEKVSVLLREVTEGEEESKEINSFWVEGTYEGSYLEGKYYFINMFKAVDEESLEDGSYLPKAGDTENEEYTIPEESIFVSEEIEEGIIRLIIEINVETGEYKIYASLV